MSELLGAFSYALDLTEGQPTGHSLRCCYIGMAIGRALGLKPAELHALYYAVLLKDLGCSSNAARIAELYVADDRSFKQEWKVAGTSLPKVLQFVFAKTGQGASLRRKISAIANILKNGDEIAQEMIQTRCTRGADIARKLRFDETVAEAIYALDEHWDGSGRPGRLTGDAIPLGARVALLAQVADVFLQHGGREAAMGEVAARAGGWLDPELAAIFVTLGKDEAFWLPLSSPVLAAIVGAMAPEEQAVAVDEDYLDDIAAAFGEVVDAKSPYTGGHSGRVAGFAKGMGETLALPQDRRRWLHRGALLHDVGKLGVSSLVLEKPGKLGDEEWVEMRGHAETTREILGRISCFADMADAAASHHERLDGAGYPLGLKEQQIGYDTRIISVCDFYDALTADRPYRAAMPVDKALSIIEGEVGKAIDGDCFDALKASLSRTLP